jgi:hypothetical protein
MCFTPDRRRPKEKTHLTEEGITTLKTRKSGMKTGRIY